MFKQICEIYSLECLLQIGQDIVDMLRSDGQAHRAWPDAGLGQLLLAHLGMGGTGRMDGQGLDVRHIGQQGKHLQPVDEGPGRSAPPRISKVKMEPAPLGKSRRYSA